jgi:hypothetical protein
VWVATWTLKKEGKIQKSLFRFELITETTYQDLKKKYLVCPLSEKCFAEKYTKGVKCSLYLEGKLDIFKKFILIISIINSNLRSGFGILALVIISINNL